MATRKRIRWGIVGTGDINRRLLPGARQSDELEVVAVASRSPERARAFAAEMGIPRAFGSYEALLADPDVDAVYVCLPNSMHHEWTMHALAAGKHVLAEKPYSTKPAEVTEAFDAADRAGLVLCEGFMWRHTPQTERLREIVPSLGELQTVRGSFSFLLENLRDIRMNADLAGGSLMDLGCYCVSAARLITGEEPERVYAESVIGPTGVDVRMAGILHFPGGVTAELNCGFTSDHMSLEAIGTAGWVQVPDPFHGLRGVLIRNETEIRTEVPNPYRLELENIGAAIRGEGTPLLGRADAMGQARTLEALYRSAATGTPVTLQ
jgi:D-xylose 1-dehydrogenase (NADP+, D-xylono-1,5-lactone-forming)